jgi:hypothetical protein
MNSDSTGTAHTLIRTTDSRWNTPISLQAHIFPFFNINIFSINAGLWKEVLKFIFMCETCVLFVYISLYYYDWGVLGIKCLYDWIKRGITSSTAQGKEIQQSF